MGYAATARCRTLAPGTLTWTVPRSAVPTLTTDAAFGSISATTAFQGTSADGAAGASTYTDQAPSCVPAA